jgi:hypothetical protein
MHKKGSKLKGQESHNKLMKSWKKERKEVHISK